MSLKEIKLFYDSLIESGDLEMLFPNLTGDWMADKKEFSEQYNSNKRFLDDIDNSISIDLDDLDF